MRRRCLLAAIVALLPLQSLAMGDDPLLTMVMIEQMEVGIDESPTPRRFEGQAWAGYDRHKLWLKSEVEQEGGSTEASEIELLYGRAVAPFWDFQVGWRHDWEPSPSQDWLAIGFQGLAPYFFEIDSTLYVNDSGEASFRASAEYELLLTQRLVLTPEVEVELFSDTDKDREIGSGLSTVEAGLRLRYEIRREFAPYIGVHWERAYGNTADFIRDEGDSEDSLFIVAGVRIWF